MQPCKHAVGQVIRSEQFGGPPILTPITNCRIKQKGDAQRLAVYQPLFEKGVEGSILTDTCPLADSGNWAECAFYEPE